jgi:rRNA-processing protein FCF1
MLPIESFERTNFLDGMKFNPEQIQLTNKYYDNKIGLTNAYGIGKGLLVGFKQSLRVVVDNNKLIVHPGALIDNEGNVLYINKSQIVLESVNLKQFVNDKINYYVYIKYKTELKDLQESKQNSGIMLHYKIADDFTITISEKNRDKTLIELARFYVDKDVGINLKMPINPFNPLSNEIDIRFAPKIVPKNFIMDYDQKIFISSSIGNYANFLNELCFRKKLLSASQASSYAYKVNLDIKINDITPWQLYDMLFELLNISLKMAIERPEITETALWKNIERLQSIFSFKDEEQNQVVYIDYYDSDSSFFSKVIEHYRNASLDTDWDNILKEQVQENEVKEYFLVGSGKDCDIQIAGDDIAKEHARLYKYNNGYYIEDAGDTSGVYVNAEKVDKNVKKYVRFQDHITLGKNGQVLNLHIL